MLLHSTIISNFLFVLDFEIIFEIILNLLEIDKKVEWKQYSELDWKLISQATCVLNHLNIFIKYYHNISDIKNHEEMSILRNNIMIEIRNFKNSQNIVYINNLIENFGENIQCDSINLIDTIVVCFQLLYSFCEKNKNEDFNDSIKMNMISLFISNNKKIKKL